jgi:hypothetical protein
VRETQYWIWTYTESDGEETFVTVGLKDNGSTRLGIASPNGLTPDQFLMADYYEEVYWS